MNALGLLPTSTPTLIPTPSFTPTSSATSTMTLTLTSTPTSTVAFTPTATLTPTVTFTPTVTLTPTVTSSPTITITPEPTLPSDLIGCVPSSTLRETGLVIRIIDGDTVDVRINNQVFRVRYIGIDTPERDERFFSQATAYNQRLVLNKTVTLVKDTSETDTFNRLLRYMIVGNKFVNLELVRSGYAKASAYPPDTACSSDFELAQLQAQTTKTGLWMPTPTAYVPPPSGGGNNGNCSPAYPDVCIAPPPPDLDCKDVPYRNFRVLSPDPHRFDGDHDGIGCES